MWLLWSCVSEGPAKFQMSVDDECVDVENGVAFGGCPGRTLAGGEVVGVGGAAYEQFRRGKCNSIKSNQRMKLRCSRCEMQRADPRVLVGPELARFVLFEVHKIESKRAGPRKSKCGWSLVFAASSFPSGLLYD
jgi:hypothetical protein